MNLNSDHGRRIVVEAHELPGTSLLRQCHALIQQEMCALARLDMALERLKVHAGPMLPVAGGHVGGRGGKRLEQSVERRQLPGMLDGVTRNHDDIWRE